MHFDEVVSWIDAVHFAAGIESDTDKYSIASLEMYADCLEKNSSRRPHLYVHGQSSLALFIQLP